MHPPKKIIWVSRGSKLNFCSAFYTICILVFKTSLKSNKKCTGPCDSWQKLYIREVIHVKNLLLFGHCPFLGGGVKPMSKKIWTAAIVLDIFSKKWSKMSKKWWGGSRALLTMSKTKQIFYVDDFPY